MEASQLTEIYGYFPENFEITLRHRAFNVARPANLGLGDSGHRQKL